MNPTIYHYPSRRSAVYARNAVAASHPLAAQAGLSVMREGGNAIDAAVAAASILPVVEPTANGIGGDAFAILWTGGKLYGLNASGYAPAALTPEAVLKKGYTEVPNNAWECVTVPGAPAAWAAMGKRFGRLPLAKSMRPAVETARYGHPLSVGVGSFWEGACKRYHKIFKDEMFGGWMALNILKGFELNENRETERNYHLQIEAMKLAFADAAAYITDQRYMTVTPEDLLSDAYADERRKLITEEAGVYGPGTPARGGTVYFAAADAEGNMVSYIQSNYTGFGSGLVVPGRGISLHSRGLNFTLDKNHPNCLAPRKKPYHTIIPGFLMKDGKPVGPFGVMGGFMQPQAHVQVIASTVDFDLNPQDTLDAPRWQWSKDRDILLESFINPALVKGLTERGHEVTLLHNYGTMGRGQIIRQTEEGVYCAGTEPRSDGTIAAW